MNEIRVLHVFASLNIGGAESMVMNIYRKIDRTKIQFDFVVNDQAGKYFFEDEIKRMGGRIYRLPEYNTKNFIAYKSNWKELLLNHPEWMIIHGHHTTPAHEYLKIAKKLNRITIAHSHTSGNETTVKSYLKVLARYPLRFIADYLFACSEDAGKWMFGSHSSRTKILNNAIEAEKFIYSDFKQDNIRKKMNLEDKFVIGHVGRFDSAKNHFFLIEIFKEISNRNTNSVLLLIGTGKLENEIRNRAVELGLSENVIFTGVRSDIHELLQVMDVFVFPSIFEGLPLTLIEAQASGLACIVSNAISYEVDITNSLKFLPLEASASYWAEVISNYSNGYNRKNTYIEICNAGYDVADNSKWLEEFYYEIVNRKLKVM